MSKKGVFMLKQIIELLLAVIAILIIIYAGTVLFRTYFGQQEKLQAKGTLEKIIFTLTEANETGKSSELLLTTPVGWYIVAFDSWRNENEGFVKPNAFFGKNAVCICKKHKLFEKACTREICRQVSMPLMQAGKQALIKIEIKDLYFMNMKDYYSVSERPFDLIELSDDERIAALAYTPSETDIDLWLKEKESPLAGLGKCIDDVSKSTAIPSSVILAVAIHESGWGKSDLAKQCNNLFGIKGEGCKRLAQEYISGEFRTVSAPFKKYDSQCESVMHFGKLVSTSPRYKEAMQFKNDPEKMVYAIHGCSGPYAGQACIYATDPEWGNKVIAVHNQISTELSEKVA